MNLNLLKRKNFLFTIIAGFVSKFGTYVQDFALSLYVLKVTGSGTKFASVLAITLIPRLILGPLLGVFADWFDRKKLIVYLDFLSGIIVGLAAILYTLNNGLSLGWIYVIVISLSIIELLYDPAIGTIIPSVIPKEDLIGANSIKSFVYNVAILLSPIVAGLLFQTYGLFIILLMNSVSFILCSILETFINIPKVKRNKEDFNFKNYSNDLKEGVTFIFKTKSLLAVVFIAIIVNFSLSPLFSIGFTYILKQDFMCSDFKYGLFQCITVIGMFSGPVVCSKIKEIKTDKIVFSTILFCGITTFIMTFIVSPIYFNLFSNSFIPYISLALLSLICSALLSICNISIGTLFQKVVPLNMMGRIGAVMSTFIFCATPLGQMLIGVMFDKTPAYFGVAFTGVMIVSAALIFKKLSFNNEKEKSIERDKIIDKEILQQADQC